MSTTTEQIVAQEQQAHDLDSLGLSRTFTVKHVYKPAAEEL
jgi:hypothetical protein